MFNKALTASEEHILFYYKFTSGKIIRVLHIKNYNLYTFIMYKIIDFFFI